MSSCPLVSVVLCTYNDEGFISSTIQSVLSQTFENFEFIIWNDGSKDSTEQIIRSFDDKRIRYFYHENTGLGKALALACAEAKGDYIARIDGDDICIPDRFQKEVDFLDQHNDYVLVSGQMIYIDEDDKEIGTTFFCSTDYIVRKRLPNVSTISHPASMFRKSAYVKCGGYEALRYMEDHLFFQRLLNYGKVRILTDVLIKYRIRSGSLIQSNTNNPYSELLFVLREKMAKDSLVSAHDVDMYNQIYLYSKSQIVHDPPPPLPPVKKKSLQYSIFSLIRPLFGPQGSRRIVISVKNCVYYIKLRLHY